MRGGAGPAGSGRSPETAHSVAPWWNRSAAPLGACARVAAKREVWRWRNGPAGAGCSCGNWPWSVSSARCPATTWLPSTAPGLFLKQPPPWRTDDQGNRSPAGPNQTVMILYRIGYLELHALLL